MVMEMKIRKRTELKSQREPGKNLQIVLTDGNYKKKKNNHNPRVHATNVMKIISAHKKSRQSKDGHGVMLPLESEAFAGNTHIRITVYILYVIFI